MFANKFLVNLKEKCRRRNQPGLHDGPFQRCSPCPTHTECSAYFACPQPGGSVSPSLVPGAFTTKPRAAGQSLVLLPNTHRTAVSPGFMLIVLPKYMLNK